MDLINPWLDANELRQLAESLLAGPAPAPAPQDAGFNEDFVGFADNQPGALTPLATPLASKVLPSAPIHAAVPAAPAALDFTQTPDADASAHGHQQLLAVLRETHAASALFVLGHNGQAVFGAECDPRLQDIARGWLSEPGRPMPSRGHQHLRFGPGRVLEIIPLNTSRGAAVAGILLAARLPDEEIPFWVERLQALV